jgi:hypothetical protein
VTPLGHTSKAGSDHAHGVVLAARAACLFLTVLPGLPFLSSPMGTVPGMGTLRNLQPANTLRMRVERTFAWEDKFKRLLLRFERIQQRHYGMKLLAYTLINLRAFCGT